MLVLILVTVIAVAAAGLYAALAFRDARASQEAPSPVNATASEALPVAPFIVFRNTAPGQGWATTFQATVYNSSWKETASWPLPGIPSRARTHADGSLLASTVFVSGHSYAAAGFSTETVIRDRKGQAIANLEDLALMLDGTRIKASDRNIWGSHSLPENLMSSTPRRLPNGTSGWSKEALPTGP